MISGADRVKSEQIKMKCPLTIYYYHKADLLAYRLPDQIHTQKGDGPTSAIKLNGCFFKRIRPGSKQRHQVVLNTIYSRPSAKTFFLQWTVITNHFSLNPGDNLNQAPFIGIDNLFKDIEHRPYGKIGNQDNKAFF
jgi:hypothetical protein